MTYRKYNRKKKRCAQCVMYVKRRQRNISVLLTRPRSALLVMKRRLPCDDLRLFPTFLVILSWISWLPTAFYGGLETMTACCPKKFGLLQVHGCNKLATRHVRLQLAEARAVPQCDICENAPAFFFCGIDGTSLCLQCDMDVHVGGKRTHERYLLLGQRVESISKKPGIEQGVALQPVNTIKDGKRVENQLPHQVLQERRDNNNAPANAIVVGDVDVDVEQHVSMLIDLNSQPQGMQGQASNGSQCLFAVCARHGNCKQ